MVRADEEDGVEDLILDLEGLSYDGDSRNHADDPAGQFMMYLHCVL